MFDKPTQSGKDKSVKKEEKKYLKDFSLLFVDRKGKR